jgi:hypothetical protein
VELERQEKELCWTERQRSAERAGARQVWELERMVSWRSVDLWRRTELKVSSREPFDDLHGSTALGAAIQGAGISPTFTHPFSPTFTHISYVR